MKRSTRIVLGVISVLAVAVCAVCIFFIVQFYRGKALSDRLGRSAGKWQVKLWCKPF